MTLLNCNSEDSDVRFASSRGFTLYELMVTLAVASVIISFGVPGFQSYVQNSRAVTHTNDLITALNLVRSEATRRRIPIDLCASDDGATCSGANDWSTGWIAVTPANEVLRVWPARSGGPGVLQADVARVSFQARGSLPAGTSPTFALQLPYCKNDGRRVITVSVAGRIAVDRVLCV